MSGIYPTSHGTYQTATGQAVTGYVYRDHLTGGLVNGNGQTVYKI